MGNRGSSDWRKKMTYCWKDKNNNKKNKIKIPFLSIYLGFKVQIW